MKPPHTFFYNFFKEKTFFVVNNTTYNQDQSSNSNLNSNAVITVRGKKFYFNAGLKLSKLEELYFQDNDSELKAYGNDLLRRILDNEKKINQDYYQLNQDLEFVEFMFYDLLRNKKNQKQIKILSIEKNTYVINDLFKHDCFVHGGKIYRLNKEKNNGSIKINNDYYNIGEELETTLEELEGKYLEKIEEKIEKQLTEGKESLLNRLKSLKEKKDLIKLLNKEEFFDTELKIGFKKDDKGFFVTTKSPKTYVLYEPSNNKYYRFGEALIGVKFTKKGNSIEWHDPVVINPYIHPSLASENYVPYQRICPGDYNYKVETNGKSLDEAVRFVLSKARFFIERGYYGMDGAHNPLVKKHYQSLETKKFDNKEVTNL